MKPRTSIYTQPPPEPWKPPPPEVPAHEIAQNRAENGVIVMAGQPRVGEVIHARVPVLKCLYSSARAQSLAHGGVDRIPPAAFSFAS